MLYVLLRDVSWCTSHATCCGVRRMPHVTVYSAWHGVRSMPQDTRRLIEDDADAEIEELKEKFESKVRSTPARAHTHTPTHALSHARR